jgi:hypothetical protein
VEFLGRRDRKVLAVFIIFGWLVKRLPDHAVSFPEFGFAGAGFAPFGVSTSAIA